MEQPPNDRPTLRSLAEITGLAVSTVSQALRDSPEISEETRRRVKLAAQQAGYRPNRAGVRLRTGKTNVITVVLNPQDDGSNFFANFVYGISEGLAGTPYHLVVTPYSLSDPMAPVRYIVETGSADGVIMSRTQPSDPRARYLTDNNMPFATHGRTAMGLAHPYYDFDNEEFAYEALRQLALRGRKRIALLGPPRELTYHIHTNLGFERGLRDFGLIGVPLNSVDIDATLPVVRQLGFDLAHQAVSPDGFVVSGVTAAVALTMGFQDAGLEIGKDFDLATKDLPSLLNMFSPKLISIPEDFSAAGRELAKAIVRYIGGDRGEELCMLVKPVVAAV